MLGKPATVVVVDAFSLKFSFRKENDSPLELSIHAICTSALGMVAKSIMLRYCKGRKFRKSELTVSQLRSTLRILTLAYFSLFLYFFPYSPTNEL